MTSDFQCVDVCGSGFFLASGNCTQCASPCQTCSALNQCNSCVSGFFYISTNIITDRCKSICPDGYFANTVSRTCDLCSSSCFKCNVSSNLCIACNGTSYLSGTQCIPSCPDGTFENTLSNTCSTCDVGCLSTCGVNQFDCTTCKSGYLR
jgi:proprotein convertase subtilisin/kexin type 5